jgi:hypothetical protein
MMIFTAFPTTIEVRCPVRAAGGKWGNLLGRTVAQSKGNSCLHQLQQMAPRIYLLVRAQQKWEQITGDSVSNRELV